MNPNEIEYADDMDFISSKRYVDKITPIMKKINLIINKDKTEYIKIKKRFG